MPDRTERSPYHNICLTLMNAPKADEGINIKKSLKLKIVFRKYLCTRFLGKIFDRIQLFSYILQYN